VPLLHDRARRGAGITRSWVAALARGRVLEIALALALGYAAVRLASEVGNVVAIGIAQHVENPVEDGTVLGLENLFTTGVYLLNFEIAGTVFFYGEVLAAAIALLLVSVGGAFVVRARNRVLGECPFCASRIPYESTHCAYCGSTLADHSELTV
jgi:large-conductance mechanosensitive channel